MKSSCLGSFLAFLFILSFTATIILWTLSLTYFNPKFYQKQFEKADFYEQGSEVFLDLVDTEMQKQPTGNQISSEAFENALKATFTPANFKTVIDFALTNVLDKGGKPSLDFSKFKPEFKEHLYAELQKTGTTKQQFETVIWPEIEPDMDQMFMNVQMPQENQSMFDKFKVVFSLKFISLLFSVLLLAVLILLSKSSLSSVFRWTGYPIAISALLTGLFGLISYPLTNALMGYLNKSFQELKDIGSVVLDTFSVLVSGASLTLIWISGVVFVVGLGLIIASYILKPAQTAVTSQTQK